MEVKKLSHTLHQIKSAVLAVAVSTKTPNTDAYENSKKQLVEQLEASGEEIVKGPIELFSKKGSPKLQLAM